MILKTIFILHYLLAFCVAIHLIIRARSSQAILAWIIAFIFVPYVSLVLYVFFGSTQFSAYAEAIKKSGRIFLGEVDTGIAQFENHIFSVTERTPHFTQLATVMKNMGGFSFTRGNAITLLINGQETYQKIFEAIEAAEQYVLLQYYIVQDDRLGRQLKDLLLKKAKQGVAIYFLYDAWGSRAFFHQYVRQLRKAGVRVASFQTIKGHWFQHWHLNFRNHRKIVIVDGEKGFTGGINLGEEYLAKRYHHIWRDTHLAVEGPSAQSMQRSFCTDWYWAEREMLHLNWESVVDPDRSLKIVAILPTGPEKNLPTAAILITQLIHAAQTRV